MSRPLGKDFTSASRDAWGPAQPAWVAALATAATRSGLSAVAKRVGYSVATLSHALANNYRGDVERVEKAVRGALMGDTVECPVVGEIPLNRCLFEQGRKDKGTSAARTRIYHKCRGIGTPKCPHSLIAGGGE